MPKILIIEDDRSLCTVVESWLKYQRFTVECAYNAADGQALLEEFEYDVVILDWTLPDFSGMEVLRQFRERGKRTPVLILTGKKEIEDKEAGLDQGADDYLTKPFDVVELSARLRALLRRPANYLPTILGLGDISLNPVNFQVTRGGVAVKLFPREFALLEFLMRHPDDVFSGEALVERVWKTEEAASPETLRTSIKRLRSKIDKRGEPSIIENVYGIGYRLSSKNAAGSDEPAP